MTNELKKYMFKRVVSQVIQTDCLALYLGIRLTLKLEWDSSLHGSCVKSCVNTFSSEIHD
ncbi:uncharacterized protein G2W53_033553 [Senna tora]|uniref:Uncharacterized protein n=1 Tax=Senna tora TaxID=362788 RepID=A0A834T099_9FABA|nr:uncharacterized protein G2W53_033553 [Senna tora]